LSARHGGHKCNGSERDKREASDSEVCRHGFEQET